MKPSLYPWEYTKGDAIDDQESVGVKETHEGLCNGYF